jgi:hypothetical protein
MLCWLQKLPARSQGLPLHSCSLSLALLVLVVGPAAAHLVIVTDHAHAHTPLVCLQQRICDLVTRDGEHAHIQRALGTGQDLKQPAQA